MLISAVNVNCLPAKRLSQDAASASRRHPISKILRCLSCQGFADLAGQSRGNLDYLYTCCDCFNGEIALRVQPR
jgi:hypothetical protein